MTATITTTNKKPALIVDGHTFALRASDIALLIDRCRYIELWAPTASHRAYRSTPIRIPGARITTTHDDIIHVETRTTTVSGRLDAGRLAEELVPHVTVTADRVRRNPDGSWSIRCEECGHDFDSGYGTLQRRFCTPCITARRDRLRREAAARRAKRQPRPKPRVERTCPQCGTRFTVQSAQHKWCSKTCKKTADDLARRELARNRPCRVCRKPLGAPRILVHPDCKKDTGEWFGRCGWCGNQMTLRRGVRFHFECKQERERHLGIGA